MYKPPPKDENAPSTRQKLPPEQGCPSMGKVKFMIEEATSRRGCLVELPWSAGEAAFVLTCQWEKSIEEPVWTLYEQENGITSKVVWTQSFAPGDLEFMYDILVMSAPKNTSLGSFTAIPDLLKPETPDAGEDNSWGGASSLQQPEPVSNFPAMAPLPQPGMMPGAMGTGLPSAMPGMPGGPPQSSYQNMPPPPQPAPHMQGSSFGNLPVQPHPGHPNQNISGQNQQYNTNNYPPQQQMGQQGYPQQPGYGGYPPQQPMPQQPMQQQPMQQQYPYQQQMPPQQMQPMQQPYQQPQPAYPPPQQYQPQPTPAPLPPEPKINIDYHLLDKRPNLLLGSMLKDAGLISEPTLEAALKLQDLIRDERMSPERAPHVLKRLHAMGGNIDQYLTPDDTSLEPPSLTDAPARPKRAEPPRQAPAAGSSDSGPNAGAKRNLKPAFDLLQTAGILSAEDIKVALEVRKSHGGDLVGILEAASKVSRKTVDAAFVCLPLIREGLLKVEQCIIALNYCSRMRVGFDDALDEMGWQNPRKMRTDLNL